MHMFWVVVALAWRDQCFLPPQLTAVPDGEYLLQNAANSVLGKQLIALAKKRGIRTINLVRRRSLACCAAPVLRSWLCPGASHIAKPAIHTPEAGCRHIV